MKPLSSIEIKLCRLQAKIFEASVDKTQYSSMIFIRRFMYSSIAKSMDDRLYLYQTNTVEDSINIIDSEFGDSNYGKTKYNKDQMYWIGYVYRCISIKYDLSSKNLYKLINSKEIVKYYNICHTFDIVDAAERIMESINYKTVIVADEAYKIMKLLWNTEKLKSLLGHIVTVYVDRPIGCNHNEIKYEQNYGFIKDLVSQDGKYQDAYIIGENVPLKKFKGKVVAIINRKNDIEDKLVVCNEDKKHSAEDIKKLINFQERNFKIQIIM